VRQGRLRSGRCDCRVTLQCSPLAPRFSPYHQSPHHKILARNIGAKAALHNLRIGRKAFTARLCGCRRGRRKGWQGIVVKRQLWV
jgi:hypothetical protein